MGWAQACRECVLCAKNKQWLLVKPILVVMSELSQLRLGPWVTWVSFSLGDFHVYTAQAALWSRSRRFSPWFCGLSWSVFVQVLASVLGFWAVCSSPTFSQVAILASHSQLHILFLKFLHISPSQVRTVHICTNGSCPTITCHIPKVSWISFL